MLTVALSVAVLPALSTAAPVTTWFPPSAPQGVRGAQGLTPDRPGWSAPEGDGDRACCSSPASLGVGVLGVRDHGRGRSTRSVDGLGLLRVARASTLQNVSLWIPSACDGDRRPVWAAAPSTESRWHRRRRDVVADERHRHGGFVSSLGLGVVVGRGAVRSMLIGAIAALCRCRPVSAIVAVRVRLRPSPSTVVSAGLAPRRRRRAGLRRSSGW